VSDGIESSESHTYMSRNAVLLQQRFL
jgi:hypothetical protein